MGFSPTLVPEGFQRAGGKPFGAPAGAYPLPRRGLTRRLRRGSGTCRPMGRSHFSFDGERKVCKRKPAARQLQRRPTSLCAVGFGLREPFGLSSTSARCAHPPGKSPLMPIFERGSSQCRARRSWIAISYDRARSCSLFSSFKKGKAFSLRCLSPLGSPAGGAGQTQTAVLGMLRCGWDGFAAQNSRLGFCSTVGINNHAQTTQLGCFDAAWIFSQHKRPAGFHIHAGHYCEP